ncbi:hypothetical protein OG395_48845 [Streptomyces sp. NBC_01320]|nr:hypothetical protein OG395_48845 [Streptomyces sp. NBC_01320]
MTAPFARNSSKWGDPRAKLLAGQAWQQARPTVLASLNLPGEAGGHLAARAALLDGTYREVAARVPDNAQIVFDDDGRLHFAALEPEPEPASLLDLRAAVNAMLPRVDLPEVLLEVCSPGPAPTRRSLLRSQAGGSGLSTPFRWRAGRASGTAS